MTLVWQTIAPQGSDYTIEQGHRYAALASASANYSLSQISDYLASHGWTVTYAWEQGAPSRGLYPVDTWLSDLSPDTTSNHRWVYFEANRTGETTTIGERAPWPLTVYSLAYVLEAVPAATSEATPSLPAPSAATAPSAPPVWPLLLAVGLLLGVGGSWLVRRWI